MHSASRIQLQDAHKTIKCQGWACHDKQENVIGGHDMTNKKVSLVGVPWQKQGSVIGRHAMMVPMELTY